MLANDSPSRLRPFDDVAQARLTRRFGTCHPSEMLLELAAFAPAGRDARTVHQKLTGWAYYDLGEYATARIHLFRALRDSRAGTRDRAVVRGLLAEIDISTGHLDRAERGARRALAQLPAADPGRYLHAGFRLVLGRLARRKGEVGAAIECYLDALAGTDASSPHRVPLAANLAFARALRGRPDEADTGLREHLSGLAPGGARGREWVVASITAQLAIARGEAASAAGLLDEVLGAHGESMDDRGRLVLLTDRAAAHRALGDAARAAELERWVIEQCDLQRRNRDHLATAANGLAESLLVMHRFSEAAAAAEVARDAGCLEDRYEWLRGYHALARAEAGLGRRDDAERTFRKLLALHDVVQFDAERERVRESMRALGFAEAAPAAPHGATA